MQQLDEVVSGWLNGSDATGGIANPAGSLFIHGAAAVETALTKPNMGESAMGGGFYNTLSNSGGGGCWCC